MASRRAASVAAVLGAVAVALPAAAASASTRPAAAASASTTPSLRFGVDPGLAGSVGSAQQPSVPDSPARDLRALRALRPPGRVLVLRLNRLFFSAGEAGIRRFMRTARADTRAGFDVEIQVRYHPAAGQAGDLRAWRAYVERVVDGFGPNRHVVAMTITNEVNIAVSPNTSDGAFPRARDALIDGITSARAEARRRHFDQLRFGFTYAYRFDHDAAFFSYLGAHGGPAFRRAVDFVGLDFYPGTVVPPVLAPGDSYRAELAAAAGTLRHELMPRARLGARVPIWITENGVPSGRMSDRQQASALSQLVRAAIAFSRTLGITDYRWFNLRDSIPPLPAGTAGPLFAFDGLLRSNYSEKPAFGTLRSLIGRFGSRVRKITPRRRAGVVRCRRDRNHLGRCQ